MADKKIDLRKQIPMTPQVREINTPNMRGTLPFTPGTIRNPSGTLAEDVPDRFKKQAEQYLEEVEKIPEEMKAKAMELLNKPQIPFEDLPQEKQDALLAAIKQSNEMPKPPSNKNNPFAQKPVAKAAIKEKEASPLIIAPEPVKEEDPPKVCFCTHCGFPNDQVDATKPSVLDKQSFVASILGQKRFYKTYDLLGEQLKITFRSLTTEENDLVIKQLLADWNAGLISGPAHSVAEATKYQMTLSLQSVETSVGNINLPDLKGYEFDPVTTGTCLPQAVAHVNDTALNNEPLRRIASKAYGRFLDLLSKLEVMADSSDFWKATEEAA